MHFKWKFIHDLKDNNNNNRYNTYTLRNKDYAHNLQILEKPFPITFKHINLLALIKHKTTLKEFAYSLNIQYNTYDVRNNNNFKTLIFFL